MSIILLLYFIVIGSSVFGYLFTYLPSKRTHIKSYHHFATAKLKLQSSNSIDDPVEESRKYKKGSKSRNDGGENDELDTSNIPFNIVRKEIPIVTRYKFSNNATVTTTAERRPMVDAFNSNNITSVTPITRDFRRIDPEEADFYNIDDDNDYLTEEEVKEADSVLEARKLISTHYNDLLEDDEAPLDITDEVCRFKYCFWALNYVNQSSENMQKRFALWTDHLQWSRRSQLIGLVPKENLSIAAMSMFPAARALVEEEFTVLAADYLSPTAQLVKLSADSMEDAKAYLQHDPLCAQHIYSSKDWRLFPATRVESLDDDEENSFDADVLSPYVAHIYIEGPQSESPTESLSSIKRQNKDKSSMHDVEESVDDFVHRVVAQSRRFQEEMVEVRQLATIKAPLKEGTDRRDQSLLLNNDTIRAQFYEKKHRIHHFGLTHSAPTPQRPDDKAEDDLEAHGCNTATGMLFIINAHSQRDALRFFQQDPLVRSFQISLESLTALDRVVFVHPKHPEMRLLLAPVNTVDVNGLHLLQPTNFASQAALDPLHAMQPTDMLLAPVHTSLYALTAGDSNCSIGQQLAQENNWVLAQLQQHKIDVSYSWMSNLRKFGVMSASDMALPPASMVERTGRPTNPIVSSIKSRHRSDVRRGNIFSEAFDQPENVEEKEHQRASDTYNSQRKKKSGWLPPLMGRRAMKAVNRYAVIATRRLLDRQDYYVPIEGGTFSVIPDYLLKVKGKKSRSKSKTPAWSQKAFKKALPASKVEKQKILDESADFYFGTDASNTSS